MKKGALKIAARFLRVLPVILGAYFSWVLRYYKHPEKGTLEERYAAIRHSCIKLLKKLPVEWQIEGAENLSEQGVCLYVGNHLSLLDPLVYIASSKTPIRFVTKKENAKIPVIGKALAILGCIFLDRDDPRQALREFSSAQKQLENGECSWVIFPEGTRNKDPMHTPPNEFHAGSLKLATRSKCPLHVVSLFGTFHLTDGSKGKSCLLQTRIHKALSIEEVAKSTTIELASFCQEVVSKDIEELREKDLAYSQSEKSKKKPRKWHLEPEFAKILEEKV